jgi:CheY-like chemotaxis protein
VAQPFDAVIADLNMPRLDGWGLLRLVREDFRTQELPVALFSAQDNYRESLRLLHAGAQAYFPKTLRLSSLEVQVRELLEPRRRFARLIASDGGISFDFAALGPLWSCRALAEGRFTGQLDARDSWATWRLWFDAGRLTQVSARLGATSLAGDRALAGFLTSRNAEGSLLRGSRAPDEGFSGQPTGATLDRLIPWLNDEQRKTREDQLAKARALTVNDDLYRLYLTVGPPAWLPMVRLLCESKLPPAEVIARLQVTPAEVAAVVKDLLRRGVAALQ